MSALSALFRKEKTPQEEVSEKPRSRQDLEDSLTVITTENRSVGHLSMAFTQKRDPLAEEKKLLADVLDIVESTPVGKKLLADTAALGYTTYFEAGRASDSGATFFDQKKIMLRPQNHSSVAAIASTMVHEMTHCVQEGRSGLFQKLSDYKTADQIKYLRAIEAGAWQTEAEFTYQIKDQHPEVLKDVREFSMYCVYEKEMDASGNKEQANAAAFKEWYSFVPYKKLYNDNNFEVISQNINKKINNNKSKGLSKTLSNEDILSYAVMLPEQKTKIDSAFLDSKTAFSLPEDKAMEIFNIAENYNKSFLFQSKKALDKSVFNMYQDGTSQTFNDRDKSNTVSALSASASLMPKAASVNSSQSTPKQALLNKALIGKGTGR